MFASGAEMLGDPARSTIALIYLAVVRASRHSSFSSALLGAPAATVGVFVPSVTAIGVTIALLLPLDTLGGGAHGALPERRRPRPPRSPSDLILRGEWEENAHRTADQIGLWTIALAVAAIAIATAIDIRRRRGVASRLRPAAATRDSDPR